MVEDLPPDIWISPSQISTWRLCRRKWGFGWVDGIKAPDTAAKLHGTETHAHLERWQKAGTPPPATPSGYAAAALLRPDWLPAPMSAGTETEKHVLLASPASARRTPAEAIRWAGLPAIPDGGSRGIVLHGYADLIAPGPLVVDYKTTGAAIYIPTDAELAEAPQTLVYGAWAALRAGVAAAHVRYLYVVGGRTGRPSAAVMRGDYAVTADPSAPAMRRMLDDVRDIAAARCTTPKGGVLALAPDASACGRFGGCPHRALCTDLTGGHKLRAAWRAHHQAHPEGARKEGEPMDLLSRLKELQAGAAAPPAPAPVNATPTPVNAPGVVAINPPPPAINIIDDTKPGATVPTATPEPAATPWTLPATMARAAATTAPEALLREWAGRENRSTVKGALAQRALALGISVPALMPSPPPPPMTATLAAEMVTGAAPAVASGVMVAAVVAEETAAPAVQVTAKTPPVNGNGAGALVVYVQCLPVRGVSGVPRVLADLVRESGADKAVADAAGAAHWGLLDFGKGPPALDTAFGGWLDGELGRGRDLAVMVDPRTPEGRVLLGTLERRAALVIRAVL